METGNQKIGDAGMPNFKDVYQYKNNTVYEIQNIAGQTKDVLCIRPSNSGEPFFLSPYGQRIEAERIVYNEKVKVIGFMPLNIYESKHGSFWADASCTEEAMVHVDIDKVDEMIAKRFGPSVKLSEESQLKVNSINSLVLGLANFIQEHCPHSHEKGTSLTFLNIAKMNAVASIANEEKPKSINH